MTQDNTVDSGFQKNSIVWLNTFFLVLVILQKLFNIVEYIPIEFISFILLGLLMLGLVFVLFFASLVGFFKNFIEQEKGTLTSLYHISFFRESLWWSGSSAP